MNKPLLIHLDEELHSNLHDEATRLHVSVSALLRILIAQHLKDIRVEGPLERNPMGQKPL